MKINYLLTLPGDEVQLDKLMNQDHYVLGLGLSSSARITDSINAEGDLSISELVLAKCREHSLFPINPKWLLCSKAAYIRELIQIPEVTVVIDHASLDTLAALALISQYLQCSPIVVLGDPNGRIKQIGDAVRFERREVWQPHSLLNAGFNHPSLLAMSIVAKQGAIPLENRIQAVLEWLWLDLVPECLELVKEERERLAKLISLLGEPPIRTTDDWCITYYQKTELDLKLVGFQWAPVVINVGGNSISIYKYPGYFNMAAALVELNKLEPGWSGTEDEAHSPINTKLKADQVLDILRGCYMSHR